MIRPPFHCDYGFNISLGAGVFIGAGSVVTRDLPSAATAFGNPARVRASGAR